MISRGSLGGEDLGEFFLFFLNAFKGIFVERNRAERCDTFVLRDDLLCISKQSVDVFTVADIQRNVVEIFAGGCETIAVPAGIPAITEKGGSHVVVDTRHRKIEVIKKRYRF